MVERSTSKHVGFDITNERREPRYFVKESDETHRQETPLNHQLVQSQNNQLELLVQKSADNFILFVDPESRMFYRYYLDGRNYIRVETLD